MQGINRVVPGISIMNVDHEVYDSNRETEYKSEFNNEDDNNSDPTPGSRFHHFSHHMNNDVGRLNPYCILL